MSGGAGALIELLGWAATAVFVASYFFTGTAALKRTQMVGALMWIAYGLFMDATPVVAANLLVFLAAAWTAKSPRKEEIRADTVSAG